MTAAVPRIVHLAAGREWRGGERQVFLLARALAERGVDQVVITSANGQLADRLAGTAVPVRGVAWRRGPSLAALNAVWSEARRHPCLLHAHDPHAVIVAGLTALLARGTRWIATRRVTFPLRRSGFWVRADRIVAVSEAVRRSLLSSGVAAERIVVVPSGIDLAHTRLARPGDVRARLGLPRAPLVVAVGALTDDKDHSTLIRAAANLHARRPAVHWAVAGSGPLRDRLETLARDTGVASVIHLVGWLDDPLPLIAAGDVFVSCSASEGLGTSLLDAMALARPIVATAVGGVPEVVGPGTGVLVEPANPRALAEAVERLLESPEVAATFGERAAMAIDRWSVGGMAEGVLRVYRSLALER